MTHRFSLKHQKRGARIFLGFFVLMLSVGPFGNFFASAAVSLGQPVINALDTVVDFETLVKMEGFGPGESMGMVVHAPDGRVFRHVAKINELGEGEVMVPDSETHNAGRYLVSLDKYRNLSASFRVLPGNDETSAMGGDSRLLASVPADANYHASAGVNRFEIEDVKYSVAPNEAFDFTVKAVDSTGAIAPAYVGTVVFASTDQQLAQGDLPQPYTFQPTDMGKKTFHLAFTFRTIGSQKLFVHEQDNDLVKGEKTVMVSANGAQSGTGRLRITRPATATYTVNTLSIEGDGQSSSKVKIFDNGQQLTEIQVDAGGKFGFRIPALTEGQHIFYVESNGATSESVTVIIDSTPPQVDAANVSVMRLAPGGTTEVVVRSDPNLPSVQITYDNVQAPLEPDPQNQGTYRGVITAPSAAGTYPVSVILTDQAGNVAPPREIGKITVDASLHQDNGSGFEIPSQVQNVRTVPSDHRVTLSWQASEAAAGIAHYRVYYGTDPQKLNSIVNTKDAKTSWYVPNLQNGTAYYFQVVGVDTRGEEGDNRSNMVTATAGGSINNPLVLCDPSPCPPDVSYPPTTPEDGPEVWGVVLAAIVGGGVWRFVTKKSR